jgi:hypothetical protein
VATYFGRYFLLRYGNTQNVSGARHGKMIFADVLCSTVEKIIGTHNEAGGAFLPVS